MIIRINGQIIDFLSDESKGWNNVEVPVITKPELLISDVFGQINISSPEAYIQSSTNALDYFHYYYMSKFEATELMYRMSKWTVSEFLTALGMT